LLPLVAFAAFGSSRYLVVASDSATAAILAGGLADLATAGSAPYVSLAGLVALLTAGLLILARLLKLGFLADFLSRTVLIGFLTGVGFQVGIAVLGEMLKVQVRGSNPVSQLLQILRQLPHANISTLCLSAAVVGLVLLLHRFVPRFPGALLAVAGAVAASAAFDFSGYGIQVVGPIAGGLPSFSVPPLSWDLIHRLLPVAGSCFVVIVAKSFGTARAYAAKHHQVLDENRDLVGISAANAAAALSGSFVVNGSPTASYSKRSYLDSTASPSHQSDRRAHAGLLAGSRPKLPTKNIIFGMALDPQELQKMLDELAASRASRRTAWTILQELRAVLKDVAGVELPPPAVKNISIEGRSRQQATTIGLDIAKHVFWCIYRCPSRSKERS
jgi:hypothetical protein